MRYSLTLNDGTSLVVTYCGASDGYLWIDVYEKQLFECAVLFSNPELTSHMVYRFGEMSQDYDNYTELSVLMMKGDHVQVSLKRGGG